MIRFRGYDSNLPIGSKAPVRQPLSHFDRRSGQDFEFKFMLTESTEGLRQAKARRATGAQSSLVEREYLLSLNSDTVGNSGRVVQTKQSNTTIHLLAELNSINGAHRSSTLSQSRADVSWLLFYGMHTVILKNLVSLVSNVASVDVLSNIQLTRFIFAVDRKSENDLNSC